METKGKPADRGYWSPLGILAAAFGIVDASFVAAGAAGQFDTNQRWAVIWFAMIFAVLCLCTLCFLIIFHTRRIYPPWAFRSDQAWLQSTGAEAIKEANRAQIEWFVKRSAGDSEEHATPISLAVALLAIRAQIELYAAQHNDEYPHFARCGWQELLDGQYLTEAPRNPHSPEEVATAIFTSDESYLTGVHVDSTKAGWVWNQAKQSMFAAGTGE